MTSTLCRLSLLVGVSLSVLGVDRAAASPILVGSSETWFYDAGSVGCPNCRATVTFELLTSTSLKVSFENTSTDNVEGVNILTAIGFNTTATLNRIQLLSQSIEGVKTWELGHGVGSGNWDIALVTDRGINDGLDNQSNFADSGYLIVGWSPETPIENLTIQGSTTKFQNSEVRGQSLHPLGTTAESPVAVVPEPGTLLLVGAGLIGMRRWRRRSQARCRPTGDPQG